MYVFFIRFNVFLRVRHGVKTLHQLDIINQLLIKNPSQKHLQLLLLHSLHCMSSILFDCILFFCLFFIILMPSSYLLSFNLYHFSFSSFFIFLIFLSLALINSLSFSDLQADQDLEDFLNDTEPSSKSSSKRSSNNGQQQQWQQWRSETDDDSYLQSNHSTSSAEP